MANERSEDALGSMLERMQVDEQYEQSADEVDGESSIKAADELLARCKALASDMDVFAAYLKEHRKDGTVEYRTFRNELKSELRFLEKVRRSGLGAEKIRHNVSSSNLPYYEALWAAAKRSSEVTNFRKWYYWNQRPEPTSSTTSTFSLPESDQPVVPPNRLRKQRSALVDVVACNGEQWIKVSTITEHRVLMEIAKQGWQNDFDSDSDEDMDDGVNDRHQQGTSSGVDSDSDDPDEVSLLKIAKDLARASRANRIRSLRPRVTFVLPRVIEGKHAPVDSILTQIRETGATVLCSTAVPPTPSIQDVLPKLLVDETRDFTSTLNIDCTILLALISDISHSNVESHPWFPRAVRQQISLERTEHLLPSTLYPLMRGRKLTCTPLAAQRMHEIVALIGTDTERARANLFVSTTATSANDGGGATRASLATMSSHAIPEDLHFPIELQPFNLEATLSRLPPIARRVSDVLTPINQAVFLSAWADQITTLSSNATVAKQIERIIEEARGDNDQDHGVSDEENDVIGPHIWLCDQSRSLVSKAGRGDGRWEHPKNVAA